MKIEQMETARLVIRNFAPGDGDDLFEILGDGETMKYCEPAYGLERVNEFLHSFCIRRAGAVAAVHRQSQKLIGYILFNEISSGVYEMGWIFNRSYWGKGYACEACKAVLDHGFEKLGVHKVFAESIDGVKSVGLMEKLGMTREGIQRSHTLDTTGHWADVHLYGLLREQWEREA